MTEEKRSQWMLLGVTPEAKEIVKKRAKKLKMGLGECVDKLIIDSEQVVSTDIIVFQEKLFFAIDIMVKKINEINATVKDIKKPWWKR